MWLCSVYYMKVVSFSLFIPLPQLLQYAALSTGREWYTHAHTHRRAQVTKISKINKTRLEFEWKWKVSCLIDILSIICLPELKDFNKYRKNYILDSYEFFNRKSILYSTLSRVIAYWESSGDLALSLASISRMMQYDSDERQFAWPIFIS